VFDQHFIQIEASEIKHIGVFNSAEDLWKIFILQVWLWFTRYLCTEIWVSEEIEI